MDDLGQLTTALKDQLLSPGSQLTSAWLYIQLGLVLGAALIAAGTAYLIRRRVDLVLLTMGWPAPLRLVARAIEANLGMIVFALTTALMRAVMLTYAEPGRSYLLSVAASLATAWLVINLIASLIRNKLIVRVVAISAWSIAALSILGVLGNVVEMLDSVAITAGGLRLSPLVIIKIAIFLAVTLWAAIAASKFLETRIHGTADLTPSVQVLISKLVRLSLITLAVLIVLSSAGINLSALAIFSGAVGVGIGFGLQKIVSNFVSGIILLADKSIKPGDVITVGDSFGWVGSMNTRYITVATRDGRELLVPNEDLVTQRVTNWTYSSRDVRLDVKFSVAAGNDPHAVCKTAIAAAASVKRVKRHPSPVCHVTSFSPSSITFLLRFWIDDPASGLAGVRSGVLLALWDCFKNESFDGSEAA